MIGGIRSEELRCIFLHELAHLKRGDIWIGWLIGLLQSLHWFNPLVWWAFIRMRADRELACDALALSHLKGNDSGCYGGALIHLLEQFSHTQHLPAVAGILENKAQLKRRLAMIADFKRPTLVPGILAAALLMLLSGCLLTDRKGDATSQTSAQSLSSDPKVQDNLNKGVQAFSEDKHDAAIQFFEKAIQLDPKLEASRMYLAATYSAMYAKGEKPASDQMALKAIEIFKEIVANAKDPAKPSKDAMLCIASLYQELNNFDEARNWSNRVLEAYPQTAEAYCRIAAITYNNELMRTGFQAEKVAHLSSEEKTKALADIDKALTSLNTALDIRPDYLTAMTYENLLLREKSMLVDDEKAKADLKRLAIQLSQRAMPLQMKAREAALKPNKPDILLQMLSAVQEPPPPTPPPPPPPRIKVNIVNSGAAFDLDRIAGSTIVLQTSNLEYWSTPVLVDKNHGVCMFTKAVPSGTYKLKMSVLGVNADVTIPPSAGAPVTLNMDISPKAISITLSK
jgi:tetratricopeptide (TPR) repeat protein